MAQQASVAEHAHQHGPDCGHVQIEHEGHVDYLHGGCLCHQEDGRAAKHSISITPENPAACTHGHDCDSHRVGHIHGPGCGHEAIPHGDHLDYLVDGHLHHPHGDHCDNHGPVTVMHA